MPELEAFRRSQRAHHHEWSELGSQVEWCPECGAVRLIERDDDDDDDR